MSETLYNDKTGEMSQMKFKFHPIHKLFKFNAQSNKSKCLISGCRVSLVGKNSTNLIRHAKANHPREYVYFMSSNEETEVQSHNSLKKKEVKLRSCDQAVKETNLTKMQPKKEINQLDCNAYRKRLNLKKQTEDKLEKSSISEPTSLLEGHSIPLISNTNLQVPVYTIPKPLFTVSKGNQSKLRNLTSSSVGSIKKLVNSDTSYPALIHPTNQFVPNPESCGNHHVSISKDEVNEVISLCIDNLQGQQLTCNVPNPSSPDVLYKPCFPKIRILELVGEDPILNSSQRKSSISFAINSQKEQPTAPVHQLIQTTSPNRLENIRISDSVYNLSDGTTNKANNNSGNSPQPSACILLKPMSGIMVLLEPNSPGVTKIPNEIAEYDPPLVSIVESLQDVSFPTEYVLDEIFSQPCAALNSIEGNSLQSSNQGTLSSETQIILSEQMRKHVQLLTQMHLITAQQSDLQSVTKDCLSMLHDLVPLKQQMEIANLDEAIDLITRWETVVTKATSDKLRKYQRPVVNYKGGKKFLKSSRKNLGRFSFHPKLVEMMAQSRVFIYPELLPKLAIFQAEQGPCKMSPHEDQLIAMGIERFTPFYADYFLSSQESMSHVICSMISQFMLPHWTAEKIENRIKRKCLLTSSANPIKYYLENKVAPSVHHVVQPFDRTSTQKLADIPLCLLPVRWRALFSFNNADVTSEYQLFPEQNMSRAVPNTSSCETHVARNALKNFEIGQKRIFPAPTSKKLKSASKTHQRRCKTVSNRRRILYPHEIKIDLEEIFIENIKTEIEELENL